SQTIGDDVQQSSALRTLLTQVPKPVASDLASQAISRLSRLASAESRCSILSAVSGTLDRGHWLSLLSDEIAVAQAPRSDKEQATVWCALAPFLSEQQVAAAWSSAFEMSSVEDSLRVLSSLAKFVPQSCITSAFAQLNRLPVGIRNELLVMLVSRMPISSI